MWSYDDMGTPIDEIDYAKVNNTVGYNVHGPSKETSFIKIMNDTSKCYDCEQAPTLLVKNADLGYWICENCLYAGHDERIIVAKKG